MLYLMLASIATSIFFGILVFLNSLGITYYYYRASVLETTLLSRRLDLYVLWFSTLVVLLVLTGLTVTYGRRELVEWLPICVLTAGMALLTCGSVTLSTVLILIGGALVLTTEMIYRASSHYFISKKRTQARIVVYLLSLVLLIEFPALIYWVVAGFKPGNGLGRGAMLLETNLTYALSSRSSWLYVVFLFGWLWAPAVLFVRRRIAGERAVPVVESCTAIVARAGSRRFWSLALSILFLAGLSIFVGYYPYWHEPKWLVGTDVYMIYKGPLDGMGGIHSLAGFEQALKEHELFLILLLGLMKITGLSSQAVLRYTPMVLTMITSIAAFWLASTLGLNTEGALLSSIASIMWVPTTMGIFTSLLANWFALILWMIFLTILVKNSPKVHVIGAVILGSLFSVAIFLIHPWSWGPFAVVTCIWLLTQLLGRKSSNRQLAFCVAFEFSGLVAGCASLLMVQTSEGARMTSTLAHYSGALLDAPAMLTFLSAIKHFATSWSPFLSPVLIVLAIVGILTIISRGDVLSRLMFAWLSATSIGSILATPLGHWMYGEYGGYIWRVFFIAPVAILCAFGSSRLCRNLERKLGEHNRLRLVPTQWFWTVTVIISPLTTSVPSVMMSLALPELGQLMALVLNLLLVTLLLHLAHEKVRTSHIMGVTMAVLIANSGLRSLAPLLVDPHNASMG